MGSLLCIALPIFLDVAPSAPILRLDDAVAAGVRHHPAIKQATAQTTAAEARAEAAKAPLFPQLNAVASYQRVRRANFAGTGIITGMADRGAVPGSTQTAPTAGAPTAIATVTSPSGTDVFTFGGSATQLIWDFGRTYGNYRSADRLASAAEAQIGVTSQNVVVNVRRAYFTARAQKALVAVARESLANLDRHLVQVAGFVDVGTRPGIDLAQAKTDAANGRLSFIDAQNAYALAKAQLAQAMGDPSGADFDVIDDELPPIDGEDLPPDKLYERATGLRPELVALRRQQEAQALSARAARGGYFPALSASGGASETGTSLSGLGPAWNVGVSLTWPLFQGGITRAQVREAEANVAVVESQQAIQRLQIRVEVQQAALNLRSAKAAQSAADDAVLNARERLRLAEGRYTSGLGNAIEIGDAQLALTTALSQLVQARFRLSSARADLLAALGRR